MWSIERDRRVGWAVPFAVLGELVGYRQLHAGAPSCALIAIVQPRMVRDQKLKQHRAQGSTFRLFPMRLVNRNGPLNQTPDGKVANAHLLAIRLGVLLEYGEPPFFSVR